VFPYLYGPSLPFYWQPFYPAVQPQAAPKFICTKKEDEKGEEKFLCEVDPDSVPPRQQMAYIRPFSGSWFF